MESILIVFGGSKTEKIFKKLGKRKTVIMIKLLKC